MMMMMMMIPAKHRKPLLSRLLNEKSNDSKLHPDELSLLLLLLLLSFVRHFDSTSASTWLCVILKCFNDDDDESLKITYNRSANAFKSMSHTRNDNDSTLLLLLPLLLLSIMSFDSIRLISRLISSGDITFRLILIAIGNDDDDDDDLSISSISLISLIVVVSLLLLE